MPKKGEKKDPKPVMDEIFSPYEYILFEKLVSLDHTLVKISEEANLFHVPEEFRNQYVKDKLIELIEQIAENRLKGNSIAPDRKLKKRY